MMLFNDEELATYAKHITTQAKIPHRWEFKHDHIGYNYRMPNINAALGCAQLENIERYVSGPVDSVIFNLGYLPGGKHSFITKPDLTMRALQSALRLLRAGGRAGLVIYTGHPGGMEEYEAVEKIAAGLDNALFNVIKIVVLNRAATAPVVIVIEKAGG